MRREDIHFVIVSEKYWPILRLDGWSLIAGFYGELLLGLFLD